MASQLGICSRNVINRATNSLQGATRYPICNCHREILKTRSSVWFGSSRLTWYRTVSSSHDQVNEKNRSIDLNSAEKLRTRDTSWSNRDIHFRTNTDLRVLGTSHSHRLFNHHDFNTLNIRPSSVLQQPLIIQPDISFLCDKGSRHATLHSNLHTSSHLSSQSYGPLSRHYRSFHTSGVYNYAEAKSKVEETVKALQEEANKKAAAKDETPPPPATPSVSPSSKLEAQRRITSLSDQDIFGLPPSQASTPIPTESTSADSSLEQKGEEKETKLTIGQKIVHEVKYFYHGFRLLLTDVRVCIRLMWLVLNGRSLTRRERRQLVRTTADLFRLVPFSVFIIVPFMEFLLPVALKLFPGLLPSTFSKENKEKEKLRIKLKTKLEMAKFLQDTVEEIAIQKKGSTTQQSAKDFQEFLTKIRNTGVQTTNEEILKYSKLFADSLTLDNLGYQQLQALCKLLDQQPIGTAAFLRFQLRMRLRGLEADDILIEKEGIDSLAVWELQEACRQRGMRALGVSVPRLKSQLQQWLDLHLKEKVPASLLLLSRALYLPENLSQEEQLKATISTLSETATEEAQIKISEVSGERVDNKARLESIRQEEAVLKKELEEQKKEEEITKAKREAQAKEAEAKAVAAAEAAATAAATDTVETAAAKMIEDEPIVIDEKEILVDKAPSLSTKEDEVLEKLEEITTKDLEEIEVVLEQVASEKMGIKLEKDELDTLKEDVIDYAQNIENLPQVVAASGDPATAMSESKAAKRLRSRVNVMIEQMDGIMGELQKEKESLLEDIEVVEVRMKRNPDLREDESLRQEAMQQIQEKKKNLVSINELFLAIKRLQKLPDDTKLQHIMDVLDEDHDGIIDIDDALKVIEVMGEENVKMTTTQVEDVLTLLRKEEQLKEERRQLKLQKEAEAQKLAEEEEAKKIAENAETITDPAENAETITDPSEIKDSTTDSSTTEEKQTAEKLKEAQKQ